MRRTDCIGQIAYKSKKALACLISSSVWISGDRPPCTQRNFPSMRAASGRQSKLSMQRSYRLSEYLVKPAEAVPAIASKATIKREKLI